MAYSKDKNDHELCCCLVKSSRSGIDLGFSLNALCVNKLQSFHAEDSSPLPLIQKEFSKELMGVLRFGSQVSGRATSGSDDDYLLALKANTPLSRELYTRWDEALGSKYPNISPHFSRPPPTPKVDSDIGSLWLEVALCSEIAWDPSQQLRTMKQEILNRIAAGQFRRKIVHGHPYWVKGEV